MGDDDEEEGEEGEEGEEEGEEEVGMLEGPGGVEGGGGEIFLGLGWGMGGFEMLGGVEGWKYEGLGGLDGRHRFEDDRGYCFYVVQLYHRAFREL